MASPSRSSGPPDEVRKEILKRLDGVDFTQIKFLKAKGKKESPQGAPAAASGIIIWSLTLWRS